MLNVYTGTLVLALHLLPAVLLWATWRLPQAAAGSKIVLGQVLGLCGLPAAVPPGGTVELGRGALGAVPGFDLLLWGWPELGVYPVPHHRRGSGLGRGAAPGEVERSITKL